MESAARRQLQPKLMVEIQMGSHVSCHSPIMAKLSTPALQKGERMDISGAVPLLIMKMTRNTLFVLIKLFWFRLEVEIPMVPYATSPSYTIITTILTALLKAEETT